MWACGVLMLVAMAFALRALGASERRTVGALLFAALAPLALGSVILSRFDLWPAAITAAALAAIVSGRLRLGHGLLGLGVAAKVYPAVLVPLALAHVWRRRGRREALICLGVLLAAVAVVFVPFLALAPGGVWSSVVRQTTRPLQIESLGAAVLIALHHAVGLAATMRSGHGSQNLDGTGPDAVGILQTVLQVSALVAIWALYARGRGGREELLRACAAAAVAFVALGKVFSPQFLIWLVPLVPLVRGRRGLAASGLLARLDGADAALVPVPLLGLRAALRPDRVVARSRARPRDARASFYVGLTWSRRSTRVGNELWRSYAPACARTRRRLAGRAPPPGRPGARLEPADRRVAGRPARVRPLPPAGGRDRRPGDSRGDPRVPAAGRPDPGRDRRAAHPRRARAARAPALREAPPRPRRLRLGRVGAPVPAPHARDRRLPGAHDRAGPEALAAASAARPGRDRRSCDPDRIPHQDRGAAPPDAETAGDPAGRGPGGEPRDRSRHPRPLGGSLRARPEPRPRARLDGVWLQPERDLLGRRLGSDADPSDHLDIRRDEPDRAAGAPHRRGQRPRRHRAPPSPAEGLRRERDARARRLVPGRARGSQATASTPRRRASSRTCSRSSAARCRSLSRPLSARLRRCSRARRRRTRSGRPRAARRPRPGGSAPASRSASAGSRARRGPRSPSRAGPSFPRR